MGWSDLPSELVITIAGNLTEFTDHIRFRSVCSHWRSSFQSLSLRLPRQLPWLALPSTSSPHFYSLSEDRVYSSPPPGVADNSNVLGSASGWFISVSGRYSHITFSLINPFTGASVGLPSPDPSSTLSYAAADTLIWDRSDSVVVAACSTSFGVFHCRLGETAWVLIESQRFRMASSITFYEGRFYILPVDTCETVVLDSETLEEITVINAPYLDSPVGAHLFVSSGELLLLVKSTWMYLFPDSDSQFYKVQRANLNDELVEWIEVNDIGDRALFVDNLHCFSVKVGDHGLLRRNCIYSAQSKTSGGLRNSSRTYSISIFDLGNSNGERLECALSKLRAASLRGAVSPPSWFFPSLS
ncbi:F-box/kelch-repeat protein [Carex littledalei]|uniref:F-box/kelch-repeat protein n=1 Tax=Carex littledalei TaxID=544730 RepID=A0A833RLK8_9POAL|nr:F-box/kelch-repeat protein [Carex littledalei]